MFGFDQPSDEKNKINQDHDTNSELKVTRDSLALVFCLKLKRPHPQRHLLLKR